MKLYIFVSFVVFFLFALFPPFEINFDGQKIANLAKEKSKLSEMQKEIQDYKTKEKFNEKDSVYVNKLNIMLQDSSKINDIEETLDMNRKLSNDIKISGYNNRKSYDSAAAKNPSSFDFINKPFAHKLFEFQEKGVTKKEIFKNLYETSFHNLPKALFIYLPIFAFLLWIFHNKKKWWYFDHGIFTLHYFSFLLLNILIFSFLNKITDVINIGAINWILYLIMTAMLIYSTIYFFIAHHRVYHSHGIVSLIIGFILFSINLIGFLFLVVGLALISFLMMH